MSEKKPEPKKKYHIKGSSIGQKVYCSEGVIELDSKTPQKLLKYLFDNLNHPSVEYK